MRIQLLTTMLGGALAASSAASAQAPQWLRYPAISPDGSEIAFCYRGEIFTVPSEGGRARRLTSNAAYDSRPVWSPSGHRIAFQSDREGSNDIFIMSREGGTPTRLTTSSGSEVPLVFTSDSILLLRANFMPGRESAQAPYLGQTYSLNVNHPGERPVLYKSMPMQSASWRDGAGLLYTDLKGYENAFRKHERSASTADVWLMQGDRFKCLTTFDGHDMDPVWLSSKTYAYVSEADGTLNVYASGLEENTAHQLTHFKSHPVRTLTGSDNGLMAFSQDGSLYTLKPGEAPRKLKVEINEDFYDNDLVKKYVSSGASNMAVSEDGSQVAIVIRGDIYVTDVKYKTTRRITDTPAQERSVSFSPDGTTLVYDSDRNGYWQLFTSKIKDKDGKSFAYAREIEETPLYSCATSAQQPVFSPDGKHVAFLEDRTALRIIDLASKKVTTALPAQFNYSYSDGDVAFEWSPDSQWLLADYIGVGGWNNKDIALVKADGSMVADLTESGFEQATPRWALQGNAITYFTSKYGMKNQGSWGNQEDIILMALNGEGWDKFRATEEEEALTAKAEEADKEKDSDKDSKSNQGKKEDKKKQSKGKGSKVRESEKKLEFDLPNRKYRTSRLTNISGMMGDYFLTPKGDALYYTVVGNEGKIDLYKRDLKKHTTVRVASDLHGRILSDKKGENLFILSSKGVQKFNIDKGEPEDVEFEALYDRHPSLEREYIYDHAVRQVNDKFHDTQLHGTDWEEYSAHYREFLPEISNDYDFAELLSELLGELNASHTGARAFGNGSSMSTSTLGAYYDDGYTGEGIKVTEVLQGGPLSTAKAQVKPGDIVLSIDGVAVNGLSDINPLLEGKAGKKVWLEVKRSNGQKEEVQVRPISLGAQSALLYDRWVERNEAMVDSLSGGRIGYVHVEGMNSPSYRTVYEKLLGKYRNRDAVVVDTRYNGGGWLHNDIAILLGGKEYVRFMPRGRYIGSEPFSQWTKPSAMVVNESNYSDAHGTPFVYQTLGIGEVVGAPVPGTMTAVWWETQVNPSLVFGIPEVTSQTLDGVTLENHQLTPDVVVYNTQETIESGRDLQLEKAVERLMEKISK